MRIIDAHAHIFPDTISESAVRRLSEEADIPAYYDGTAAGLVGAMDRAGIDVAVAAPVATKPSQVRSINDWIATVASDRIVPFGAIHPDSPDPFAEAAHMRALGIRGIKMHSEYQGFAPDEERMGPIYDAAIEQGLVLLMHAGEDVGPPTLRGTPEAFARALDARPGLVMILAHMGGFRLWGDVRKHLLGREVYFDTAYTLGHLPDEEFVALARDHGVSRILFGSDGPWTDAACELSRLREIGFEPDELDAILGGNAGRLLGL